MPLDGLRVWITRPEPALADSAQVWQRHGAVVLALPTLEIQACAPTPEEQAELARALDEFDGALVVLPSPRATDHFVRALGALDARGRPWAAAALGVATAERARVLGLELRLVSSRALGAVLAEEIVHGLDPRLVLLPSSDRRRPELGDALRAAAVRVVDLTVHHTVPIRTWPADVPGALADHEIDLMVAYSPSALAFVEHLDPAARAAVMALPTACLGSTTAATARELGFTVVARPEDPGEDALLAAVARWWSRR